MAANRQQNTRLLKLGSDTRLQIATYLDRLSFLSLAQTSREMRIEVLCSTQPTPLITNGTPLPSEVLTIANRLQIKFETISARVRYFAKYLSQANSPDLGWQIECLSGCITDTTINRIIAECKKSDDPLLDVLHEKKVLFFIILSDSAKALEYLEASLLTLNKDYKLWDHYWIEPLTIALRYKRHNIIKYFMKHMELSYRIVSSPQFEAIWDYVFKNNSMDIVDDMLDRFEPLSPGSPVIDAITRSLRPQTSFQFILNVWKKLEEHLIRDNYARRIQYLNALQNQFIRGAYLQSSSPVFYIFTTILTGDDNIPSPYNFGHRARDFANIRKNRSLADFQQILSPSDTESYTKFISEPAIVKHTAILDIERQNLQMFARKKFLNSLDLTLGLFLLSGIATVILFSPIGALLSIGITLSLALTGVGGFFAGFLGAIHTLDIRLNNQYKNFVPTTHTIPPLESTPSPTANSSPDPFSLLEHTAESKESMPTSRPLSPTAQSSLLVSSLFVPRKDDSSSPGDEKRTTFQPPFNPKH